MKEAIGSIPLYNFIIVFIILTFAFLSATLTYYKAFKVNSKIAYSLEEHEGYNSESIEAINFNLASLAYKVGDKKQCKEKKGAKLVDTSQIDYPICIYEFPVTSKVNNGEVKTKYGYFNYGITTYIYLDLPVIKETISIPVYTESERIFRFSN